MVDILLIQPPIRDFYLTAKRTIPYGLICIAASLMKEGFSVDIFDGLSTAKSKVLDLPSDMAYLKPFYGQSDLSPFGLFHYFHHYGYSFEYIGQQAKASGAFLIGISSLFTAYSNEAILTAESVKKHHPDCRIVVGGHHATAMPWDVLKNDAVDYVLRGEGEVSLPMLAKALMSEKSLTHIPGIAFRKSNGTLYCSEPAVMKNPDTQPFPATTLIKHAFYKRKNKASAVIVASRGCPMKCSYCTIGCSPYIPYRQRSVKSVISEIDLWASRHGIGFIDFEDENLSVNKSWFLTLLNQIRDRFGKSGIELRAMNGLFPGSLDEELIYAMKAAGFKILNLSLGSILPHQLKRFKRPNVSQSLSDVLELADKYGLEAVVYIIAAAPGQAAEDSIQDLLYIASKKALVGLSIFYPAPGSADYGLCESMGILPESLSLMRSSALPISDATTRVEAVTLLRLARVLNFIKSLTNEEMDSLTPLPFSSLSQKDSKDRRAIGFHLLCWFLHDGKIRGVTSHGEIYEHLISKRLTTLFLKGIKDIFLL